MNPIHLSSIYSALVNKGNMVKPYLLDGESTSYWKEGVFTGEAADTVLADLYQVVENSEGTAHSAQRDGFRMAGKTGTAENEGENAHAWFVGFSNVDDPDLVVCVIIENIGTGSHYAAPVAREVFDSYYNNEMYKTYR